MITGKDLIEKMYSENYDEYEDTRLYSTGDSDLDDLLERAFCEGYEYAQKEYSLKDELKKALKEGDEEKIKRLKRKATGAGVVTGAAVGGITGKIGYKKLKDGIVDYINKDGKISSGNLDINNDDTYNKVSNLASGIIAGGTGLAGGIIGKARFNRALKKANKELENEK